MVKINDIQDYLEDIKSSIPAINTALLVIDDSQLTKILDGLKESENLVLLGIIPSHKADGLNANIIRSKDFMAFLILKKADRKIKHSDFIANMGECQQAGIDLVRKLINDIEDYNDGCSFLNQLNAPSITVDPVYSLGGSDGYEINFELYTGI